MQHYRISKQQECSTSCKLALVKFTPGVQLTRIAARNLSQIWTSLRALLAVGLTGLCHGANVVMAWSTRHHTATSTTYAQIYHVCSHNVRP